MNATIENLMTDAIATAAPNKPRLLASTAGIVNGRDETVWAVPGRNETVPWADRLRFLCLALGYAGEAGEITTRKIRVYLQTVIREQYNIDQPANGSKPRPPRYAAGKPGAVSNVQTGLACEHCDTTYGRGYAITYDNGSTRRYPCSYCVQQMRRNGTWIDWQTKHWGAVYVP